MSDDHAKKMLAYLRAINNGMTLIALMLFVMALASVAVAFRFWAR